MELNSEFDSEDDYKTRCLTSAQDWTGVEISVDEMDFKEDYGRTCSFRAVDIGSLENWNMQCTEKEDFVLSKLIESGLSIARLTLSYTQLELKPGEYNDIYIDSVVAFLEKLYRHGFQCIINCTLDYRHGALSAPPWALETVGVAADPHGNELKMLANSVFETVFFTGKLLDRESFKLQKELQGNFIRCFSHLAKRVYALPAVFAFELLGKWHRFGIFSSSSTMPKLDEAALKEANCATFWIEGKRPNWVQRSLAHSNGFSEALAEFADQFKIEIQESMGFLIPVLHCPSKHFKIGSVDAVDFSAFEWVNSHSLSKYCDSAFFRRVLLTVFGYRFGLSPRADTAATGTPVFVYSSLEDKVLELYCEICEASCVSFCVADLASFMSNCDQLYFRPSLQPSLETKQLLFMRKNQVLCSIIRPYASRVPGKPTYSRFDPDTLAFSLVVSADAHDFVPKIESPDLEPSIRMQPLSEMGSVVGHSRPFLTTNPPYKMCEIFLPNWHYADYILGGNPKDPRIDFLVRVSDGEWEYNRETQTLYWWYSIQNTTAADFVAEQRQRLDAHLIRDYLEFFVKSPGNSALALLGHLLERAEQQHYVVCFLVAFGKAYIYILWVIVHLLCDLVHIELEFVVAKNGLSGCSKSFHITNDVHYIQIAPTANRLKQLKAMESFNKKQL